MAAKVGVVGASGFSGAELLRLVAGHPTSDVVVATSREFAGRGIEEVYPNLGAYHGLRYVTIEGAGLEALDLVFLALPHGASVAVGARLADAGVRVVDFSADFRLTDPAAYQQWYGFEHAAPQWLGKWVYGIPELHRDEIRGAAAVANPGCYPTAAALALAPLIANRLIEPGHVTISAASGVSGAGRGLSAGVHFSAVDASYKAYSPGTHKHTPEIEQELSRLAGEDVCATFVPHLVPMTRGLLATCTAPLANGANKSAVEEAVDTFSKDEPFVTAVPSPPETKFVAGSNGALVWATADERTGTAIAVCAIDNLGKGAAGQALQNANLMLGLDETMGLTAGGIYP